MRVLMTTDAVGGVWTYALELCAALQSHEVEVVLATMGPMPSEAQCTEARRLENVRLVTSAYKLEWMDDPWADVEEAGAWLLQLARESDVDLVHLNGYSHAALPWTKPVVVVAHSCVYSWWLAIHGSRPPQSWERYRVMVENGLLHADAIVAPTHAFLSTLRGTYTFAAPQFVIRNANHAARSQTDASEVPEPFILASGRLWDDAKNLRVLDEVAIDLPWPVLAAGETTSPDGRPIALDRVNCLGRVPRTELRKLYERASIFVHPALYEPFGLSVLEAAQSSCALVLADIPTLRELWNDAAVFVDPRDPVAIRSALRALIVDESARLALAARAHERAAEFRSERMSAEYLALYASLLHSPERERSVA